MKVLSKNVLLIALSFFILFSIQLSAPGVVSADIIEECYESVGLVKYKLDQNGIIYMHSVEKDQDNVYETWNISQLYYDDYGQLKYIGTNLCSDCKGVKRITIPEGVEAIGSKAFAGFSDLQKVYLPTTMRKIANDAFNKSVVLISTPCSYVESFANKNGYRFSMPNNVSVYALETFPNTLILDKGIKGNIFDIRKERTSDYYDPPDPGDGTTIEVSYSLDEPGLPYISFPEQTFVWSEEKRGFYSRNGMKFPLKYEKEWCGDDKVFLYFTYDNSLNKDRNPDVTYSIKTDFYSKEDKLFFYYINGTPYASVLSKQDSTAKGSGIIKINSHVTFNNGKQFPVGAIDDINVTNKVKKIIIPDTVGILEMRAMIDAEIDSLLIPDTVQIIREQAVGYESKDIKDDVKFCKRKHFIIYANPNTAGAKYAKENGITLRKPLSNSNMNKLIKRTKKATVKPSLKKGSRTIKWKTKNSIDGYYVYASTKKKATGKPVATIWRDKKTKVSYKIKSSDKHKYYKIRPFRDINGMKYFGKFSKVLKV